MFGKSTFGLSMWLLKWFPIRFVDQYLLLMSDLMLGDTAQYRLHRPKLGPLELKNLYGKTPVLDVGTLAQIKSGKIKLIMEKEGKGEKTIKITNPRSPFYVHASDNPRIVFTLKLPRSSGMISKKGMLLKIPRQYQLKSGLPSVKQHGMSLGAYYTKLRAIWDELEGSRSIPSCPSGDKCPVTKHLQEESEKDRVYQFLMGLDDAIFGNLRSQILNTSLLPSINRIYSMATQEETHKAITRSRDDRIEAVGYVVQASPPNSGMRLRLNQ
ncbi:hypothetical protein SESBI_45006 [Sesbania bispinosa]|nr:hypothetical protein SESBI_45006 [Sesbania bispinosa]